MWTVQLKGDPSDLSHLSQSLTGGDINVCHDGQEYFLTSDTFADCNEARIVRQKAEDMIAVLNGASRLRWMLRNQLGSWHFIDTVKMEDATRSSDPNLR